MLIWITKCWWMNDECLHEIWRVNVLLICILPIFSYTYYWVRVAHLFLFLCVFYYVSLRSEVSCCDVRSYFRMKSSVGLYLKLFVGELMSYWRYLCLFVYSGVQHHIALCFSSSCVPYVASVSGLSIFDCPFGIL